MSLGMPPAIFFAYPSRPALRRTLLSAKAAEALTETGEARGHTWESLSIGGRLIIAQITTAIDGSVLSVFDTTEPNENVLFELGYAIGAKKRVWLIRDRLVRGCYAAMGQVRSSESKSDTYPIQPPEQL